MHYVNPGKWLRELFPEQTKSIRSILIWSVVYFLDIAIVFYVAAELGFSPATMDQRLRSVIIGAFVVAAFVIWWIETAIYGRICSAMRKK